MHLRKRAMAAVALAWTAACLGGCGTDGTTLGTLARGCPGGQTYCTGCNGGGFCSAGCPKVACPLPDDAGGGGGSTGCPASMPVACSDCGGGTYCVSGTSPALSCPALDAGSSSSNSTGSSTTSGTSSSTCITNLYCPYGQDAACRCKPAPDAGSDAGPSDGGGADGGASDAGVDASGDGGTCGAMNGPCCSPTNSGCTNGLTCCQGVPYPVQGICQMQCTAVSDYHQKSGFEPVNPEAVLERVRSLTMTSWSYDAEDPSVRHMGPMAQEFRQAFGLGDSDRTIYPVDGVGVSLAAIQALGDAVDELRSENRDLAAKNARLEVELRALRARTGR
jgi:hypothetical protein